MYRAMWRNLQTTAPVLRQRRPLDEQLHDTKLHNKLYIFNIRIYTLQSHQPACPTCVLYDPKAKVACPKTVLYRSIYPLILRPQGNCTLLRMPCRSMNSTCHQILGNTISVFMTDGADYPNVCLDPTPAHLRSNLKDTMTCIVSCRDYNLPLPFRYTRTY